MTIAPADVTGAKVVPSPSGAESKPNARAKLWRQKGRRARLRATQSVIGRLFESNDKDFAQAKEWRQKAADLGDRYAKTALQRLQSK